MASLRPVPLATVLVSLLASVPSIAMAAEPEGPTLVAEAVDLRRQGHDAEALAVLERAMAADPSPRTRAQVALAEQALGLWVEAERDLGGALATGSGSWFDEHRGALTLAQAFVQEHLATLEVRASVAGAEVRIDGQVIGRTPLPPFRVLAGSIVLEVGAPGYAPDTRTVSIAPKGAAMEEVDLTSVISADPMSSQARPASSSTPNAAGATSSSPRKTLAWIALGTSVATGVGAAVALLVRDSNAALYDDDSRCFFGGLTRDQRCGAYHDAANAAQVLMITGFAAAAVSAAGSVALFSVKSRPSRAVGAACGVGLELWCRGSF